MYPYVHSNTIYNNRDMETTCIHQQMNGWRRLGIYMQWNIEKRSIHKNIMKEQFAAACCMCCTYHTNAVSQKEKDKSMTSLISGI